VLFHRLVKRRREAPRLAYLPWLLVATLFAGSALLDERRDMTSLLALLPLAFVMGHVLYPTVLGWAVLWVPAALGSVLLAIWPQEDETTTVAGLMANIVLLLAPALAVMLFPPRIRRGASQLRFIAAAVVSLAFVGIAFAVSALHPGTWKQPLPPPQRPRNIVQHETPGRAAIAWRRHRERI